MLLTLLVEIKNQNSEILQILKQSKSSTGMQTLELPANFPLWLSLQNLMELRSLEEYLREENNVSALAAYFTRIGGKDRTSKINGISRNFISNKVVVEYSFLGTRHEKRAFSKLNLQKVVLIVVLSTDQAASENEVNNAIKVWLKHAPKRLKQRNKTIISIFYNNKIPKHN
ncbi:hypothetical protein FQA39_LY01461 [Lamprigera yunnana]|nr:hypothetical protein FQA39_LY01461 [Lamprigera yunnana]